MDNTTVGKFNDDDDDDREQKEGNNELPAQYQQSNRSENGWQGGEDTQGGRERPNNGRGNCAHGGRGRRGARSRVQGRGGRPLNNGATNKTGPRSTGTITNGKPRSRDKVSTLSTVSAKYTRKYMKTPLNEPITIDAAIREELTVHQRLNVMIRVAADRVNRLTGINTTQCTRTWHMQTITFLLNVCNGINTSKRESKKMQENKDEIILDCMKIKVIDCDGIFRY